MAFVTVMQYTHSNALICHWARTQSKDTIHAARLQETGRCVRSLGLFIANSHHIHPVEASINSRYLLLCSVARRWHDTLIQQFLLFIFRLFTDQLFGRIWIVYSAHYSDRFEFESYVRYGPSKNSRYLLTLVDSARRPYAASRPSANRMGSCSACMFQCNPCQGIVLFKCWKKLWNHL